MEIDWLELWRELTVAQPKSRRRVGQLETRLRRKTQERPDPLLTFVSQSIESQDSVLDIGAGTGRWTIPLAEVAESVTAVEPSEIMRDKLRQNITAANLDNVRIIPATWEEAVVRVHDAVVCAHAMYGSPDLAAFVHKMERFARKRCYLAVRLPAHGGIIGELSLLIYGHRYDSPNAIIAYNALYSLGICANVVVEEGIFRWVDANFEKAFARAKRHLRLEFVSDHDELIHDILTRRLNYANNSYKWPDGMRSALLWWAPSLISG